VIDCVIDIVLKSIWPHVFRALKLCILLGMILCPRLFVLRFFSCYECCLYFLFASFLHPRLCSFSQLHMDMMGKFSNKTLKRHLMSYERMEKLPHFSEDFRFRQQGIDKVSDCDVVVLCISGML